MKILQSKWSTQMDEFRSFSIKQLTTGAGEYEICAGSPQDPEVIVTRSRKNCRSDAVRDDWECRKIRQDQPVSQHFKLAKDKLARLEQLNGQVWYRMKPIKCMNESLYEEQMIQYAETLDGGLVDGQKMMRELGFEQFADDGNFQGMIGNRIMRRLVDEGVFTREKITHNLDRARSGRVPVYGYGINKKAA